MTDDRQPERRQPDPEMVKAMQDLTDMMEGTGRHADHSLKQVGRCVYCSCGMRVQGQLPRKPGR